MLQADCLLPLLNIVNTGIMELKALRNEQGKLSGIVIPREEITELKNSLKTDSEFFRDLDMLLAAEEEAEKSSPNMPSDLTVSESNARAMRTTENLYMEAFAKGVAMYYRDERAKPPKEFIRANPDGSEDLVSFDALTRTYSLIKQMVPAGQGRWAYLL